MAMAPEIVILVLGTLKKLTNSGQCFTAFDITKAVRSQTEDNVRHDDVKVLAHQFFEQGFFNGFTREPHTFISGGVSTTAQLFIPPNGDASTYNPDKIRLEKDSAGSFDSGDSIADTSVPNLSGTFGLTGINIQPQEDLPKPVNVASAADTKLDDEDSLDPNDTLIDDDCCGGSCHPCVDEVDEVAKSPLPPPSQPESFVDAIMRKLGWNSK